MSISKLELKLEHQISQTISTQQYKTIVNLFGCKQLLIVAKLK